MVGRSIFRRLKSPRRDYAVHPAFRESSTRAHDDFQGFKKYPTPEELVSLASLVLFQQRGLQPEETDNNSNYRGPSDRTLADIDSLIGYPTAASHTVPNPSRTSSVQPRRSEDSANSLIVAYELTSKILEIDEMLRRVLVILDKEERATNIETRSISSTVRSQEEGDEQSSIANGERDARFLRKVERLFIGRYIAAVKRKFKKKGWHASNPFRSHSKGLSVKAACEDDLVLDSGSILPICDGRCELPANSLVREIFELEAPTPFTRFELEAVSRLPSAQEEQTDWGEKPAQHSSSISSPARPSSPSSWATVSPWMTDLSSLLGVHKPVEIGISPSSLEYQPNPVIFAHLRSSPPRDIPASVTSRVSRSDKRLNLAKEGISAKRKTLSPPLRRSPCPKNDLAKQGTASDDFPASGQDNGSSVSGLSLDSLPTFSSQQSSSPINPSTGNKDSNDEDELTCKECNIGFKTLGLKK